MILPNIENFIGCDSSFEEAEIVLYGAPFDSTQAFALEPGSVLRPFVMKALDWKPTALIRTATLQIFRYLTVEIWSFASAAVKRRLLTYRIVQRKS